MNPLNTIITGDSLEVLRTLENESVDCIITSPPYWGLRDYGVEGQVGLEKSLNEYLVKMLLITGQLKRILKPTGTMWWNHGDSYSHRQTMGMQGKNGGRVDRRFTPNSIGGNNEFPEKSLLLQAYRLALRMIDEQGWILRNQIIWHKPNCMPSSVRDRFTVDFEPIFFFTKSKRYWFELQREKATYTDSRKDKGNIRYGSRETPVGVTVSEYRTKRSVWKISPKPFKEAHFATFPEALIETPIKAGCPEFVCSKCGKAKEKIWQREKANIRPHNLHQGKARDSVDQNDPYYPPAAFARTGEQFEWNYTGFTYTDCGCGADFLPGIVLDPFMGAGTTAVVAKKLGRNYIGIELNPEYVKIAATRIKDATRIIETKQPTLV